MEQYKNLNQQQLIQAFYLSLPTNSVNIKSDENVRLQFIKETLIPLLISAYNASLFGDRDFNSFLINWFQQNQECIFPLINTFDYPEVEYWQRGIINLLLESKLIFRTNQSSDVLINRQAPPMQQAPAIEQKKEINFEQLQGSSFVNVLNTIRSMVETYLLYAGNGGNNRAGVVIRDDFGKWVKTNVSRTNEGQPRWVMDNPIDILKRENPQMYSSQSMKIKPSDLNLVEGNGVGLLIPSGDISYNDRMYSSLNVPDLPYCYPNLKEEVNAVIHYSDGRVEEITIRCIVVPNERNQHPTAQGNELPGLSGTYFLLDKLKGAVGLTFSLEAQEKSTEVKRPNYFEF